MPAGTSAPASSDVLGLLNTKPANTPPTMGGGNWLTVGSWNKPPTGQSLTDWNSWLGKIGVPQNTFGQFLINPVTGQYSLPTNQNLQGGIGSKPAYQTFPLYNQPTTPTTNTPTTTTPPPSIYTPDMPNYVGRQSAPKPTAAPTLKAAPAIPTQTTSPMQAAWLNAATKAGYNPSRLMSYYNRRNQRIQ